MVLDGEMRFCPIPRWLGALAGSLVVLAGWLLTSPGGGHAQRTAAPEVIATGVPRPLQLVIDGGSLLVLSPGNGDSAGEIYRVDLTGELPVNLARQPRITIPFAGARPATLGSLALDPVSRELILGEENGNAIYRLTRDGRLIPYATGLNRLAGGGTLAVDRAGRLVILDYADPRLSPDSERLPPGLEDLREEDYRGPLVFRLTTDPTLPLPRRLGRAAPLFPRVWGGKAGGALLPHLIAVAPLDSGDLVLLSSAGELYRLTPEGRFIVFAHLPHGFYNRITMVAEPDGSVLVSGGFHVPRILRVSSEGLVSVLADDLADPEGIALDGHGHLYVAESSLHRIVRLPDR
jgi:hypothetical protein